MTYDELLNSKRVKAPLRGMDNPPELSDFLFPHQRDTVEFLLRRGSGAAFLDTGLGKTAVELEWSKRVMEHINKPVLIFAPLAVGLQHQREAERFGIEAKIVKNQDEIKGAGVYITNYDRHHLFDKHKIGAVALDESSCIKAFGGKTSMALMDFAAGKQFSLAATATPAPNDHMELGQHSQFLGAMASNEMLARWFVTDQSEMGKYRLKRHGIKDFWSWVASWARCVGKPSDLGYCDDGYILPELVNHLHSIDVDITKDAAEGELFRTVDLSATNIHNERRKTSQDRADFIADLVRKDSNEPWMVWVDTDYDADSFLRAFPDAVDVRGSMSSEMKEERLNAFSNGQIPVLLSKPSIAGFGLNWQHCARTAFVGLSFSYEAYYQAIRRFWRFGQKRSVQCHVAMATTDQSVWQVIQRKKREHEEMKAEMFDAMRREVINKDVKLPYQGKAVAQLPSWIK